MTFAAKQKLVSITHFINPHLFWYRYVDASNEKYGEVMELENQLSQYYKNQRQPLEPLRRPSVNATVAVKFLSWNKLIRARLEHISTFNKNVRGGEYIMWALDYGFPFQASGEHIFELPEQFGETIGRIHCGGLIDILPAEKDFMRDRFIISEKKQWNQSACKVMEKVINEADSIVFTEKFYTNDQTWGKLNITTHLGVKYIMRDFLIGLDLAISHGLDFHKTCFKLETTKIPPWMTNDGNSKFSTNKPYLYPVNRTNSIKSKETDSLEQDNLAKRKVEDWHTRNRLVTENDNKMLEVTITDFQSNFSNGSYNLECLDDNNPTCTEGSDHRLGLAGTLTKSRLKNYSNRSLPPKPSDKLFEISFEFTTSTPDEQHNYSEAANFLLEECVLNTTGTSAVGGGTIKYEKLLESSTNTSIKTEQHFKNKHSTSLENSKANSTSLSFISHSFNSELNRQLQNLQNNLEKSSLGKKDQIGKYNHNNSKHTSFSYAIEAQQFKSGDKKSQVEETNKRYNKLAEVVKTTPFKMNLIKIRKMYLEGVIKTKNNNDDLEDEKMNRSTQNEPFQSFKEHAETRLPKPKLTTTQLDTKSNFHDVQIIPAGFDLINLYHYNDENHWHRRATTLHDYIPHDNL